MDLSTIILIWVFTGMFAGTVFTYLDVHFMGYKVTAMDIFMGVMVIGGVFGPLVFLAIARDLITYYPHFKLHKGE